MRIKINFAVVILLLSVLTGCHLSYDRVEFDRAERALKREQFKEAVKHFSRVIKRSPESDLALEAARNAARVSLFQTEDFIQAIQFFRHVIIYSKSEKERKEAQRNIATIYFDKLTDYKSAIVEFNKLLSLSHSPEDETDYKLYLAKSYFYLNNFFQAKIETDELLKRNLSDEKKFEILLFKGNILMTSKEINEALGVFEQLKKDFPELAKKEKVDMSIAVCYEELNNFAKAISVLEELKADYPHPEFIDLKIKRLEQRQANLPGAKGFRK